MLLKKWDDLPVNMKNDCIRKYYEHLYKKRFSLFVKKIFDVIVAILTFIILSPVFIILCIVIKIDSKGPILFRQVRVTQYGKQFRIFKFRTMINNADKLGKQITIKNDTRVTKVGRFLRKLRLDELPQLFNIILGDMSFVGTRPEVLKYIEKYTSEMMATLLMPAGITSEASIHYKDEEKLLVNSDDADEKYINEVLPEKMKYNLRSLENFSFWGEVKTMIKTIVVVIRKDKNFDNIKTQIDNVKVLHS